MKSLRLWIGGFLVIAVTALVLDRLRADGITTSGAASGRETARAASVKSDRDEETVQVAKLIDSVIQPRFLKEAGQFGVRRLAGLNGHDSVVFTAEDKTEKKTLEKVDAFGRDYFLAFLHMAHTPGKYVLGPRPGGKGGSSDVQPRLTSIRTVRDAHRKERLSEKQWASLLKLAADRLPELRKGKDESATFENWGVTLRPVLARESCLDCHEGAKEGETLGVMLYAVEKKKAAEPPVSIVTQ